MGSRTHADTEFKLPLRLTVDEFARISRLCPETVRRMIRAGILKVEISPSEVTATHFYGLSTA